MRNLRNLTGLTILASVILVLGISCSKSPTEPDKSNGAPLAPPASPDSLEAVQNGKERVDLSWLDRSGNETGFTVVRRPIPGAAKDTVVLDTLPANSTTYSDMSVREGENYRYTVGVFNGAGGNSSTNFADIEVQEILAALGAPSNLTAKVFNDTLTLTWEDKAGKETGYQIVTRSVGPVGGRSDTIAVAANTTEFKIKAPSAGEFGFKVRAYDRFSFSKFSNEIKIDFATTATPVAPSNLEISVDGTDVTMTWDDNSDNEMWFTVQISKNASFNPLEFEGPAGTADQTVYHLNWDSNPPEMFYFRIGSSNAHGTTWGNEVGHVVPYQQQPDLFVEAVEPSDWPTTISQGGTFSLSGWSITNGGETDATAGFEVFLWKVGQILNPAQHRIIYQPSWNFRAGQSLNLSYLNVTIDPGTTDGEYWLMIAVDRSGLVDEADEANNGKQLTLQITTPQKPDYIIEPDETYGFLVLPRKADAGQKVLIADCYVKNIGPVSGSTFSTAGLFLSTDTVITKTDFLLKDYLIAPLPSGARVKIPADSLQLPPGLTSGIYYIGALADRKTEISEVYETNNYMAIDIEIDGITVNAPPVAPSNLNVSVLNRTATLNWHDNSSDEIGFEVELIGDNPYAVDTVYSLVVNAKTLQINGLKTGIHHLRVRAFNTWGKSAYSNKVNIEVANGTSTGTLRIVNNLTGAGSGKVLRFRVGPDDYSVLNYQSTELLESEGYCNFAPGADIAPGEWMTVDVSGVGANYTFHLGLGRWTYDLIECPEGFGKQMWATSADFDLLYSFIHLDMTGHTAGQLTYSIEYDDDDNIVLTDGVNSYPFQVLVNVDPINW